MIGPQSSAAVDAGSVITFATINFAGGPGANGLSDTAALTVEGGDVVSALTSPSPVLSNLSIQNSAGHGIVFAGVDTGFAMGSGSITVSSWEMTGHYPFVIEANQASTLPTSISAPSTPPSPNAVVAFNSYVNPGYCDILTTQTWPSLPVPILSLATLELGGPQNGNAATLTISAPNTFEFIPNTELDVDPAALGLGFLVANGTNGSPLVFTSTDGGAWGGINFSVGGQPTIGQTPSSLTYAVVEYANNSIPNGPPGYGTGAITVANDLGYASTVPGPTIANCRIENYPSYGITLFDIQSSSYSSYTGSGNSFGTPAPVLLPDGGPGGAVSSYCQTSGCTDTGPGP